MSGGADRCAKTITLQQEVSVTAGPSRLVEGKIVICDRYVDSSLAYGTRVWADIIVTCNRKVGHTNRHAFQWTRPDPEDWPGEE